jgi:hypothetical protein
LSFQFSVKTGAFCFYLKTENSKLKTVTSEWLTRPGFTKLGAKWVEVTKTIFERGGNHDSLEGER